MIRPFEEVNKDWTFFDWDEWNIVRHKIGEDKFEEIKYDLYNILKSVYGVGLKKALLMRDIVGINILTKLEILL